MKPKKLIIGSTAIKHWYPEFREPKDLDVICEEKVMTKEVQHYWIPEFEILLENNKDSTYLDPDLMLALKCSHANWLIHWDKTMADILFLKRKGHTINKDIYYRLVKGWRKVHGRESAPLKGKTKDEFFSDAVKRIYDHDSIHDAVAFYDEPLFHKIRPSEDSVECAEDLFEKLSHEDKIKLAREEIYVTALERFVIPLGWSPGKAYMVSLRKFVTTMSSNWMSLFLIENFDELRKNKFDYVQKFKDNTHKLKKL